MSSFRTGVCYLGMLACAALLAGCGNAPAAKTKTGDEPAKTAEAAKTAHPEHGEWCDEHGMPEAICVKCNPKLAEDFKKNGDWCKDHDRPDSQCFVCHPELEAKFAAQYEAKFGKTPPKPEG